MPGRFLRDAILWSRVINKLSEPAENFYRRLMSVVDDFGRCEADIEFLTSACYPIRRSMSDDEVQHRLDECVRVGVVKLYEVDGRKYLEFQKLGEPRAEKSKHPAPPWYKGIVKQRKATLSDAPSSSSFPSSFPTTPQNSGEPASPSPVAPVADVQPEVKPTVDVPAKPRASRKPPTPESSAYTRVVDKFCQCYEKRTGLVYDFKGKEDGAHVKSILKTAKEDVDLIFRATELYFASDDRYLIDNGMPLRLFKKDVAAWLIKARSQLSQTMSVVERAKEDAKRLDEAQNAVLEPIRLPKRNLTPEVKEHDDDNDSTLFDNCTERECREVSDRLHDADDGNGGRSPPTSIAG